MASGRVLREWELVAVDKEIEVLPGVKFAAWTYNGRIPGPTLRCREGDRLRITFANGSSHPHTMHFHGIHPAEMDGVPGLGDGEIPPGGSHRLRVRRAARRAAPLPLPRAPARGAHRQGPLRRVHRRPEGRARGRRRGRDGDERVRHELRPRERGLRRQHDRLRLHGQADRRQARRARPRLPRQRARVRPDQLVPPAREPVRLLPHGHARDPVGAHRHGDAVPGPAGDPRVALPATPASSCSTRTSPSSPSSAGRASSRSSIDGGPRRGRARPARTTAQGGCRRGCSASCRCC